MQMHIPYPVLQILQTLNQSSYEAYLVGGCVRDALMGAIPHDWDITTNATPEQVIHCFHRYRVVETGLQHGTVTVVIDHASYEITTYRCDGEYLDHRRPSKVTFTTSLQEDLCRRDFTINAMAYHPEDGLIDPFHGQQDLHDRLVRCVGEPDVRFGEDALRIMRALRFAAVLGFAIEDRTGVSMIKNRDRMHQIAAERIHVELCKLICGQNADDVLRRYADLFCVIVPEITPMIGFAQAHPYHHLDLWEHTIHSISHAPNDVCVRLALLFHDIGKLHCYTFDGSTAHFYGHAQVSAEMCSAILKRLKLDSATIRVVQTLVFYHDADLQPQSKCVKRWLFKIGEERFQQLLQVQYADIMAQHALYRDVRLKKLQDITQCMQLILAQQQCFHIKDLNITGKDILSLGIPQGRRVGMILHQLMDMVIDEEIENNYDKLLEKAVQLQEKG